MLRHYYYEFRYPTDSDTDKNVLVTDYSAKIRIHIHRSLIFTDSRRTFQSSLYHAYCQLQNTLQHAPATSNVTNRFIISIYVVLFSIQVIKCPLLWNANMIVLQSSVIIHINQFSCSVLRDVNSIVPLSLLKPFIGICILVLLHSADYMHVKVVFYVLALLLLLAFLCSHKDFHICISTIKTIHKPLTPTKTHHFF